MNSLIQRAELQGAALRLGAATRALAAAPDDQCAHDTLAVSFEEVRSMIVGIADPDIAAMFAETGLLGEMVTARLRRRNESRPSQLLMPLHRVIRMLEASVIAFCDALAGSNASPGK